MSSTKWLVRRAFGFELPRTCLVHRFGAEDALGGAMIVGRVEDIALGGGG